MDGTKLKILIINHSDTAGGASVVSRRLMDALCAEGADARMLVVHKNTDSLRVAEAASPRRARLPFLAEHADIYLHNGRSRDTLFRISTGRFGLPLHDHPWVREADVILLNWVNQGMLSLREIGRIASRKPVIWTMHDQWNMTGVCHYTAGCDHWLTGCHDCPLVGRGNMAARVYAAKKKLYERSRIRFVAVSHRLAELCRQSPLMADAEINVIPNAFPVDRFGITPALTRHQLGLPDAGRIVVMGAARLDDPVKNLPLAIEALNRAAAPDILPVFYGEIRCPEILKSLKRKYIWLGVLHDTAKVRALMARAAVVLSTSVWETLPGTVIEGIASGAVAVATDNGGQADIVTPGVTGYLVAANATPDEVAEAIDRALELPQTPEARAARHHDMATRFGAPAIARRYLTLFSE